MNLNNSMTGSPFQVEGATTDINQIMELNKALTTGQVTGNSVVGQAVAGSATPLKMESLDRELKLLTFRDQDVRMWRLFPKGTAYSTVEEVRQLVDYGTERGGTLKEGGNAAEVDSTYRRIQEAVKYYGAIGSVSHQSTLVRTGLGDMVQREIQNKTLWMLRKINRSLAFGSAKVIPDELNGIYRQHERDIATTVEGYYNSDFVIDLKGATLTQSTLQDAAHIIYSQGFGQATHVFSAPQVLNDFAKDYYSIQRSIAPFNTVGGSAINIGHPKEVDTSFGNIKLEHDIFLATQSPLASGTTKNSPNAPNAPVSSTASAPVTDTSTQFKSGQEGDYKWAVAAINEYGRSDLKVLDATAVTVAATEAVDLTFTDGGGAYPASGYTIYRTVKGATEDLFYPIFEVSTADLSTGYNGAAAGKIRDRNFRIAKTEEAFVAEVSDNTMIIKQLAPLMKQDLATINTSIRFQLLCYLTFLLVAPKRVVKITNIGV